jgi:hypothetical protein
MSAESKILAPHYVSPESAHYAEVRAQMMTMGAPRIRAIWDTAHDMWIAIEGSHRLAVASELGLLPLIEDVGGDEEIAHDFQDVASPATSAELAAFLTDAEALYCNPYFRCIDSV